MDFASDVKLSNAAQGHAGAALKPEAAPSAALEIDERLARLAKRLELHQHTLTAVHGRAFGIEPQTGSETVRPSHGSGIMHQIADRLEMLEDLLSNCEAAANELYRIV